MALVVCVVTCYAADGWIHDDFEAAQKQAKAQKKGILIEFTGSDWCRPCQELKKNVLGTPYFIKKVGKYFVLLELDYPQKKSQDPKIKAANETLAQRYRVGGFPTVVFADATGKPVGGFMGGKPKETVMNNVGEAIKCKNVIQAAETKLAKATTEDEKVDALAVILKNAPKEYLETFYAEVKNQLKTLDKNDKSGLQAEETHRAEVEKQTQAMQQYVRSRLRPGISDQEALKAIQSYPEREKLLPEVRQRLLMLELHVTRKIDPAPKSIIPILDKVIAIDPDTEPGRQAATLKLQIK